MHYVVHDVIFITFVVIFFLALFRTGQKILQWLESQNKHSSARGRPRHASRTKPGNSTQA